jgi:hypothetical protein
MPGQTVAVRGANSDEPHVTSNRARCPMTVTTGIAGQDR